MDDETRIKRFLDKMLPELDRRAKSVEKLESYNDGPVPMPEAVKVARLTHAYKLLLPVSAAPWGSLVTNAVATQLEVAGIRSRDTDADKVVSAIWSGNDMDVESKLAIDLALTSGRAFAIVWPDDESGGDVRIDIERADQVIVMYREGSRRDRVAALRRWVDDDDRAHVTLYLPDRLYKLEQAKVIGAATVKAAGVEWQPRTALGDAWTIANPYGVVPVIELPVNLKKKPGQFPHVRGEFEHVLGLIDRINLLTFLGLVVAMYMGFPLRGVIGEKVRTEILKDDDGRPLRGPDGRAITRPLPPFDPHAAGVVQFESKDARTFEFAAADRGNLSVYAELGHLAALTSTPQLYVPTGGGISNISADTIRGLRSGLDSKVDGRHKLSLGAGFREVLRLAGLMSTNSVVLDPAAEFLWIDHRDRSLGERADAFLKLTTRMPWHAAAEVALQASPDTIARWEAQGASSAIGQLVAAAQANATPPAPAPDVEPAAA